MDGDEVVLSKKIGVWVTTTKDDWVPGGFPQQRMYTRASRFGEKLPKGPSEFSTRCVTLTWPDVLVHSYNLRIVTIMCKMIEAPYGKRVNNDNYEYPTPINKKGPVRVKIATMVASSGVRYFLFPLGGWKKETQNNKGLCTNTDEKKAAKVVLTLLRVLMVLSIDKAGPAKSRSRIQSRNLFFFGMRSKTF